MPETKKETTYKVDYDFALTFQGTPLNVRDGDELVPLTIANLITTIVGQIPISQLKVDELTDILAIKDAVANKEPLTHKQVLLVLRYLKATQLALDVIFQITRAFGIEDKDVPAYLKEAGDPPKNPSAVPPMLNL